MKRIDINPNTCCGCSACANICAHKAITMEEDDRGFLLPVIDETKCVECGLCLKVCDFKKEKQQDCNTSHIYSLIYNDTSVVKQSSSGGAFTAFSNVILKAGGMIVGAVMESDFSVHHVLTCDVEIRDQMRGSKYVQSSMGDIYSAIKEALKAGKKVLFSGTPCQCAAVKSVFANKYDNLYIVDFLCHGVPSNKLFKEHIAFLETQYKKRIKSYYFRSKRYGWNAYSNTETHHDDGSVGTKMINQAFLRFFSSSLSLRDSCFHCKYRSQNRCSDVTIADFWDIDKLTGKTNCTGASLVLTNTEKGNSLIKEANDTIDISEFQYENVAHRIQLSPDPYPKRYDEFWSIYKESGYPAVVKRFFNNSFKRRMDYSLRKIAKKIRLCIFR